MHSTFLLGGAVVAIGGGVLDGKPSRLGPDLTATGAALIAVVGLSVWFGIVTRSRAGQAAARFPGARGIADGAPVLAAAIVPAAPLAPMPRTRLRPATAARVLSARVAALVPMLLTIAVLFGIFLTSHDGPRHVLSGTLRRASVRQI